MLLRALLFALCLSPSFAYAETTAKVELGEPYKVIDAASKNYFHAGKEMVAVKIDGDTVYVQHFDTGTLKQVSAVKSKFPDDGVLESFLEADDTVYCFYSVWNKKEKQEQLFVMSLDPKTGAFPEAGTRIVVVDGKVTGALAASGFYSFTTVGKFKVHHDADGKNVMVEYRRKPEVRDDSVSHDIIGVAVFGPGVKELWHREFTMPYTEEKMDRLSTAVDGSGVAYMLAKVREGEGKKEVVDGQANYHVEVLKMDPNSADIVATPISFAGKFIETAALFDAGAAGLMSAGIYYEKAERGVSYGFYTLPVGKTEPVFHEIPKEILQQYATAREKRKAEKDDTASALPFMQLKRLIASDDGALTLIGEQTWVQVTRYTSANGVTTTTYTYHYQDILVAHVNGAGKLAWMRRIPKEQVGPQSPGGLSFYAFEANNKEYILYFDNVKNLNLAEDEQPAAHMDGRGGYLTAMVIDNTSGAATKLSVFDSKDVEGIELFQVGANRIIPIAADSFVMEAYKKKKEDILLRVSLP